ncbi:MAG: hypothetical protein CMJ75_06415 [Planctomycetaceae bacterium]|nr:hypothetical protein [Planctomycetaceae bacterium]
MTQPKNSLVAVHQLIDAWQQEVAPGLPVHWEESLLLRDGFLWGRKFCADGLVVVWELASGRLVFVDENGQTCEVSVHGISDLEDPPIAKAA